MTSTALNVLVTRPEHQAETLIQLLEKEGLCPIKCPSIAISAPKNPQPAINTLRQLNRYNYVVFISANAANQADALLKQHWPETTAEIIAIGPKTQAAIENIGLTVSMTAPTPFNSEQLIASFSKRDTIPENASCLIIKGEGGRNYLENALNRIDITVKTADVYRRRLPVKSLMALPSQLPFITITSQLALDNLWRLYPNDVSRLKSNSRFIVLSQRIANYAYNLGCKNISIATSTADKGIVLALLASINN